MACALPAKHDGYLDGCCVSVLKFPERIDGGGIPMSDRSNIVIGLAVWAGIGYCWWNWDEVSQKIGALVRSEVAACQVVSQSARHEIFLTGQGEADAGIIVEVMVKKTEKSGNVTLKTTVSSTEGNIEKERTVSIALNSTEKVALAFPELTINANDIRYSSSCRTF